MGNEPVLLCQWVLLQGGVTKDCADSHMDLITITPDDGHLTHIRPLCLFKTSPPDTGGLDITDTSKLKKAE